MTARDWPTESLRLVTADDEMFAVVRRWAQGNLHDVPANGGPDGTLLIVTPGPWCSIVAISQRRAAVLRPVLILKNAVALWPLRQPPPDGPLPTTAWAPLRRLVLIHNPGLGGILSLLDHAVMQDVTK